MTSAKTHTYRADVDGLRAVAILPVILFHAGLGCSGGFVGVDIFFVISGYLITSLIWTEMNENRFSLFAFWERRARRILPALLPVVIATLIAGWIFYMPNDYELLGRSVMAQTVFISNIFFWRHTGYFDGSSDVLPLLHTWSLAVEEQFYLIFPLLLLFLARRKRFPLPGVLLFLCIGSLGLSIFASTLAPSANFYWLPTRAWELLMGALIAITPNAGSGNQRVNELAGLCGLLLILFSIFCYSRDTVFPGLAAIPPCLGAALIIFSGNAKPTAVSRMLALKPAVFIGLISYALYLWHWPLLAFAKYISIEAESWHLRVSLLMISALLAILSWKFVETPFRKRLLLPRRSQIFGLAGASMVLLLLLGSGIYLAHGISGRLSPQALAYQNHPFDASFWKNVYPDEVAGGNFVALGAQNTNQPVELLLWGDSHAMAVAPALDELCRKFSVRGGAATHIATPPLLGYVYHHRMGLNEHSLAYSQAVVDYVARKHVKIVVLAARWSIYRPAEVVNARLAETVQALMASGSQVYVLKDVPTATFDVPRSATLTVLRRGDLAGLGISTNKYAAENLAYNPAFTHLSSMGASVLDTPKYFLGSKGHYEVVRNGMLLYNDDNHLTADGAKLLCPMFEELFRSN